MLSELILSDSKRQLFEQLYKAILISSEILSEKVAEKKIFLSSYSRCLRWSLSHWLLSTVAQSLQNVIHGWWTWSFVFYVRSFAYGSVKYSTYRNSSQYTFISIVFLMIELSWKRTKDVYVYRNIVFSYVSHPYILNICHRAMFCF